MMAKIFVPSHQCLRNHVAVRLKDSTVVVSSTVNESEAEKVQEVSTYNLWTEEWRKCTIPWWKEFPVYRAYAIAIETDIYVFGGSYSEYILWKLTRRTDGSFAWKMFNSYERSKVPSPRSSRSGWEHGNKLWIFGGFGVSPIDYLNEYGDFFPTHHMDSQPYGRNNQLFCYDPSVETWKNVKTFGDILPPPMHTCAALIDDKVWLYVGRHSSGRKDALYELSMTSFEWTQIDVFGKMATSPSVNAASLTPITPSQLVLHSGSTETESTWVFDVKTYTWKQIAVPDLHHCYSHTAITGLNSVIVLGRSIMPSHGCNIPVYCLMVEPKSLQQLSMTIIHENKTQLPWKTLAQCLVQKLEYNE